MDEGDRGAGAGAPTRGRNVRRTSNDTFEARRNEIQEQVQQLKEANSREQPDLQWCESQLFNLTAAWEAADAGQRSRLVAGIFDQLEAEMLPEGRIRVVAVPRPAWRPFLNAW